MVLLILDGKMVHNKPAAMTFKLSKCSKDFITVLTTWLFKMPFHIQATTVKTEMNRVISVLVAEQLRLHLAQSAEGSKYSQTSTSCGFFLALWLFPDLLLIAGPVSA